jgi:hypothetical protein
MKTLNNRLLKLESRLGLLETAASRRDHELGQILLRRMAVLREREGLPPLKISQEFLSRVMLKDILYRAHAKERARAFAESKLRAIESGAPRANQVVTDNSK